jgi:hypothetical protein
MTNSENRHQFQSEAKQQLESSNNNFKAGKSSMPTKANVILSISLIAIIHWKCFKCWSSELDSKLTQKTES